MDSLYFKIFEEQFEDSEDAKWAREFSLGKCVIETLPFLTNRKVFEVHSWKQVAAFYSKLSRNLKDLIKLAKNISK